MTNEEKNFVLRAIKIHVKKYEWEFDIETEKGDNDCDPNWGIIVFEKRRGIISTDLFHSEYLHRIAKVAQVSDFISVSEYREGEKKNKPYFKFF